MALSAFLIVILDCVVYVFYGSFNRGSVDISAIASEGATLLIKIVYVFIIPKTRKQSYVQKKILLISALCECRGKAKLFSLLLVFNFKVFSSKLFIFFGVRQDIVVR